MEKFISIIMMLLALTGTAFADQYVNGYMKNNGTYVQPYHRSEPDNSYNNNYSTRGNTNPYTGQSGTESPTWNNRTPEYNQRSYGSSGTGDYMNGSNGGYMNNSNRNGKRY